MSEGFKPTKRLSVIRWARIFSAPEQIQEAGENLRKGAESIGLRLNGTSKQFPNSGSIFFK